MGRFQALSHEKSPQTHPPVLWTAGKLAKRREKQSVKGASLNEVSDSLVLCEGTRLAGALEAFFKQTFELFVICKKNNKKTSQAKNSEITRLK